MAHEPPGQAESCRESPKAPHGTPAQPPPRGVAGAWGTFPPPPEAAPLAGDQPSPTRRRRAPRRDAAASQAGAAACGFHVMRGTHDSAD